MEVCWFIDRWQRELYCNLLFPPCKQVGNESTELLAAANLFTFLPARRFWVGDSWHGDGRRGFLTSTSLGRDA